MIRNIGKSIYDEERKKLFLPSNNLPTYFPQYLKAYIQHEID